MTLYDVGLLDEDQFVKPGLQESCCFPVKPIQKGIKIKYTTVFHLRVCMTLFRRNGAVLNYSMLNQTESAMINMEYFTTVTWGRQIRRIA